MERLSSIIDHLSSLRLTRHLWTKWKEIAGTSALLLGVSLVGMARIPADVLYYGALSRNSLHSGNPAADLAARSPGLRVDDELQKNPYSRPLASQRVLSGIRETPYAYEDQPYFGPYEIDTLGPPPVVSTPYVPDRVSYFSPPVPFTAGPGGLDYPGTVSEPVAAVPELSTWAMMIIGFFGTGMTIRRRLHGPKRYSFPGNESHGCG